MMIRKKKLTSYSRLLCVTCRATPLINDANGYGERRILRTKFRLAWVISRVGAMKDGWQKQEERKPMIWKLLEHRVLAPQGIRWKEQSKAKTSRNSRSSNPHFFLPQSLSKLSAIKISWSSISL